MNKSYPTTIETFLKPIVENTELGLNEEMEKLLQDLGINPARLSKKVKKKNPGWVDFMRVDIKGLMDCEAVVCFGDYGNSKGSMLEQVIAKSLEIPIYRYDEIANKLYEPHHG